MSRVFEYRHGTYCKSLQGIVQSHSLAVRRVLQAGLDTGFRPLCSGRPTESNRRLTYLLSGISRPDELQAQTGIPRVLPRRCSISIVTKPKRRYNVFPYFLSVLGSRSTNGKQLVVRITLMALAALQAACAMRLTAF